MLSGLRGVASSVQNPRLGVLAALLGTVPMLLGRRRRRLMVGVMNLLLPSVCWTSRSCMLTPPMCV